MRALRSQRLELRPLDGRDAAFVQALYAEADVRRGLLRIQAPLTLEQARAFAGAVPTVTGDYRFGAALQSDAALIGVGGARSVDVPGVATIGYSLLPAYWGRGFGTEMATLLVEFATRTLGAREVRATTLEDNTASMRVLQKVGFVVLEAEASEVDSRGARRRVTRWALPRDLVR